MSPAQSEIFAKSASTAAGEHELYCRLGRHQQRGVATVHGFRPTGSSPQWTGFETTAYRRSFTLPKLAQITGPSSYHLAAPDLFRLWSVRWRRPQLRPGSGRVENVRYGLLGLALTTTTTTCRSTLRVSWMEYRTKWVYLGKATNEAGPHESRMNLAENFRTYCSSANSVHINKVTLNWRWKVMDRYTTAECDKIAQDTPGEESRSSRQQPPPSDVKMDHDDDDDDF